MAIAKWMYSGNPRHAQTAGRKEPDRGKSGRFSGGRTMAVQAKPSRSLAQGSTGGFVWGATILG